jgi:3-oxoacyl-(acyl-carrier-protein) synthase
VSSKATAPTTRAGLDSLESASKSAESATRDRAPPVEARALDQKRLRIRGESSEGRITPARECLAFARPSPRRAPNGAGETGLQERRSTAKSGGEFPHGQSIRMKTQGSPPLPANQVLVSVGTPCNVSAVGTTETHRALATGDRRAIGFAALDAGLVEVDLTRSTAEAPCFVECGLEGGAPLSIDDIERRFGAKLRSQMGIRELARETLAPHVQADIGAPLPHDLERGGLRRLAGLTFTEIRQSSFSDMFGLFDDDPRLGPSLQAQLFLYGGLGALASLPVPLSSLVAPHRFRVAAGCAFPGLDSLHAMSTGMQQAQGAGTEKAIDKLAFRLSATLGTHGPALLSAMLSPSFSLSKVRRNPALLEALVGAGGLRRVPQAPLVSSAACASALMSLSDIAPQLLGSYPGAHNPQIALLTAADAAIRPDGRVLEGFGLGGALVTRQRLAALNAGRPENEQRSIGECLCPFDVDGQGTVVGHGGSGLVITTLDFALRHFLDITSVVVGFGQSNETGGKGHFAGVGFGGENATILALLMASAHGFGVNDFRHLVAHATGTRTNSRTDLSSAAEAREVVRRVQGVAAPLAPMSISAPKALGDGHSMGETGLKAIGEAIQYVLGRPAVGIPTLRRLDDQLEGVAAGFRFSSAPVPGDADGGALIATQGFGGYDAAVALRSANPATLRRYDVDPRVLDAYLERWSELRRERAEREARLRRTRGFIRKLAEEHCWPSQGG